MQQRMTMSLREANPSEPLNLADSNPTSGAAWTGGATLIDAVPLNPPLQQTWTILAWALSFAAGWVASTLKGPSFGKLGALWAGVLSDDAAPTLNTSSPFPWVTPMRQLPADPTTLAKVWDGSQDPMFPAIQLSPAVQWPTLATYSAAQNLPLPLQVRSGTPLHFGLWLTPSLVANTQIAIAQASVSLIYDDGVQPQGGTP
jgi:hypothetical protein